MADSSKHKLPHFQILLGLFLGALIGSLLNYFSAPEPYSDAERQELVSILGPAAAIIERPPPAWIGLLVTYVTKPLGDLFMNLLFLAIIPLVFASLVVGVTRLGGLKDVGRIGAKTISYFLITTFFAAIIGLSLVNVIRPGEQLPPEQQKKLTNKFGKELGEKLEKKTPFGIETFVNVIPKNPLKAFIEKDMLAVIFTSILVGIALTQIEPKKAAVIVEFLEGVNQVMEFIIRLAMKVAPLGVFMLMFTTTALFGYQLLLALLAFVLTVLGGLAIHLCVVLPLLVWIFGRMNPLVFFKAIIPTLATAFSTSSSSATLPTAIRNAEEDLKVPTPIAQFVLPLSASMNHNGTALFEAVTVVFLAQVFGVHLSIGQEILVVILCILTATGMAGVPGGSLPLIGLILESIGVPGALLAIVLGVDRILDMCRTTVNVAADMTTAVFVARSERKNQVVE